MTDIEGLEFRRARWRRALRREALDTTTRGDFAVAGLASRLRAPSIQILLLPADPEADCIRIDAHSGECGQPFRLKADTRSG